MLVKSQWEVTLKFFECVLCRFAKVCMTVNMKANKNTRIFIVVRTTRPTSTLPFMGHQLNQQIFMELSLNGTYLPHGIAYRCLMSSHSLGTYLPHGIAYKLPHLTTNFLSQERV